MTPIPEQPPHFTEKDGGWMIDMGALRKCQVMVATPSTDGDVCLEYLDSLERLVEQAGRDGVSISRVRQRNSLVTTARNDLTAHFLAGWFTHLIWRDADEGLPPDVCVEQVYRLLASNLMNVGLPVPLKKIDWRAVAREANNQRGFDEFNSDKLEAAGLTYAIDRVRGRDPERLNGCVEVERIGTGLKCLKVEAIAAMIAAYPDRKLRNRAAAPYLQPHLWDFWTQLVVDGESQGEDYGFDRLWRDIGGRVWCYEQGRVNHIGNHAFEGRGVKLC
jgi:hypothetical protein